MSLVWGISFSRIEIGFHFFFHLFRVLYMEEHMEFARIPTFLPLVLAEIDGRKTGMVLGVFWRIEKFTYMPSEDSSRSVPRRV